MNIVGFGVFTSGSLGKLLFYDFSMNNDDKGRNADKRYGDVVLIFWRSRRVSWNFHLPYYLSACVVKNIWFRNKIIPHAGLLVTYIRVT